MYRGFPEVPVLPLIIQLQRFQQPRHIYVVVVVEVAEPSGKRVLYLFLLNPYLVIVDSVILVKISPVTQLSTVPMCEAKVDVQSTGFKL